MKTHSKLDAILSIFVLYDRPHFKATFKGACHVISHLTSLD